MMKKIIPLLLVSVIIATSLSVAANNQKLNNAECSKNYQEAELEHKDFSGQNLEGANFEKAELDYANFKNANLKNANFKGADIEKANFEGANLEGANFEKADLEETSLFKANIKGAIFKNAELEYAIWTNGKVCAAGSIGSCW